MAPLSWKALTSSRLSSLKEYVTQKDYRATYDALSSRVRGNRDEDIQAIGLGIERVQLFPGWAVRRFNDTSQTHDDDAEFNLDIYISGFASSLRPPEAATRSQKAFYRLAKGYAALPKLNPPSTLQKLDIPSDLDLSKLPPRPCEITGDTDLEALEAHFKKTATSSSASSTYGTDNEDDESDVGSSHRIEMDPPRTVPPKQNTSLPEQIVDYAAQSLHANLDARLQPFWSNAIPNRLIRLSVFCPHAGYAPRDVQDTLEGQETDSEPLAVTEVMTNQQGAFGTQLTVPWERLATHPLSLHVAFGDRDVEYPVVIQAEMWAPLPPVSPSASSFPSSVPYTPYRRNSSSSRPSLHSSSTSLLPSTSSLQKIYPSSNQTPIRTRVTISLPTPFVPLRLVSDIDDTIKHSGILLGVRHVFHNVFVRHLEDLVLHDMVQWYKELWQKGVRFHYVSNSPFELLPVLNEFFHVSSFPAGSIRLKSYAARSLLPALLSPPAARKKQGVVELLDAFPESHFILVGDIGEQDLELYTELARERPRQVVGVFLRDVSSTSGLELAVPGASGGEQKAQSDSPLVDTEPKPIRPMPSMGSLSTSISASSSYGPTPRAPPRRKSSGSLTTEERRRQNLELRIERARADIPSHTAFRVFRDPVECVEAHSILDRFLGSKK